MSQDDKQTCDKWQLQIHCTYYIGTVRQFLYQPFFRSSSCSYFFPEIGYGDNQLIDQAKAMYNRDFLQCSPFLCLFVSDFVDSFVCHLYMRQV